MNIKTFDGTFRDQPINLAYNMDKNVVRIICPSSDVAQEYLTKLIVGRKIGAVDTVIFSVRQDSVLVALMRGPHLNTFLRRNDEPEKPVAASKKSFSEMAESNQQP